MLNRHTPSMPHSRIPGKPFVKIGELTNHYSTGTEYTCLYSDDPKNDLPPFLDQKNFTLADEFKPTVLAKGVECKVQLFQWGENGYNVYLRVPTESTNINIGQRKIVLNEQEVKEMTLKKLSDYKGDAELERSTTVHDEADEIITPRLRM